MLYWRAGVCPLAVAYFVTEDSVDKFSHLEELINSRTPHAVGHISRTVEPQAAKIACASTNRIVQACVIFYTQAAFLYSYCYEQQYNAYILVWHRFSEINAWCIFRQSCVATCDHTFVIGCFYPRLEAMKWWGSSVASHCWVCAFHVSQVHLCPVHRNLSPRIISTYLCKLPWGYCHTRLPARSHYWAIVRHPYLVGLRLRIDVPSGCTWQPCVKRSTSSGSLFCDHQKGQS